jgi:hypothetical protein
MREQEGWIVRTGARIAFLDRSELVVQLLCIQAILFLKIGIATRFVANGEGIRKSCDTSRASEVEGSGYGRRLDLSRSKQREGGEEDESSGNTRCHLARNKGSRNGWMGDLEAESTRPGSEI